MELKKNALYLFPAITTNKPATLARKARYMGLRKGAHTFRLTEVRVGDEWLLVDDASDELQKRGRKRIFHEEIRYTGRLPPGVILLEEPREIVGISIDKKGKTKKRMKRLDPAMRIIQNLLDRRLITAEELAAALR